MKEKSTLIAYLKITTAKRKRNASSSSVLMKKANRRKSLASRNWYNNEREQLEWEMQNAELYGYDKEDIQSRMDSLDGQEQSESWYSNED